MKKIINISALKIITLTVMIFLLFIINPEKIYAQNCTGNTPSYSINLSGKADSVWVSPSVVRNGQCCGEQSPTLCIEFTILLDSMAMGLKLDISGGTGATYYRVNCLNPTHVGDTICLNGVGPHYVTVCKPGGNAFVYTITSIPKPQIVDNPVVTYSACPKLISVQGLKKSTIEWSALGSSVYNTYLSCTTGCDSTYVTLPTSGTNPSYIDYVVTGYNISYCDTIQFRDTVRAVFVDVPSVTITPEEPKVCFGSTNTPITANPSGGVAPYYYEWSNSATTQTINVGAGTYIVKMKDQLGCFEATDTVVVTSHPQIIVDAGNNIIICSNDTSVTLSGSITNAEGGTWSGGSGLFYPNDSALNAVYYPSASEKTAGSVLLFFTTYGHYNCDSETDSILITIHEAPQPAITGNLVVCEGDADIIYQVNSPDQFSTYTWSILNGNIVTSSAYEATINFTSPVSFNLR